MLPPSFIEYALRSGADGVVVTGCRDGGCEFRLGMEWTRERLTRNREPELRALVPLERIEGRRRWHAARAKGWSPPSPPSARPCERNFSGLPNYPPAYYPENPSWLNPPPLSARSSSTAPLPPSSATSRPHPTYKQIPDDVALVKLSMSHLGGRECRKRTPEELQKLPPNMRAPLDCPRGRSDIKLRARTRRQAYLRNRDASDRPFQGRRLDGLQAFRTQGRQLQAGGQDERQPGQPRLEPCQGGAGDAQAGAVLVIDFNPDKGGLFFQQAKD
jgi:hypothetical protein